MWLPKLFDIDQIYSLWVNMIKHIPQLYLITLAHNGGQGQLSNRIWLFDQIFLLVHIS